MADTITAEEAGKLLEKIAPYHKGENPDCPVCREYRLIGTVIALEADLAALRIEHGAVVGLLQATRVERDRLRDRIAALENVAIHAESLSDKLKDRAAFVLCDAELRHALATLEAADLAAKEKA